MYPLQMRKKILEIKKKEKLSIVRAAKRFGISPTTLFKWTKRLEAKITREKAAVKIDMNALQEDVNENPDAYQYERAAKFGVSQRCIGYGLKRLGVSYKKNTTASKSGRKKAYYLHGKDGRISKRRKSNSICG